MKKLILGSLIVSSLIGGIGGRSEAITVNKFDKQLKQELSINSTLWENVMIEDIYTITDIEYRDNDIIYIGKSNTNEKWTVGISGNEIKGNIKIGDKIKTTSSSNIGHRQVTILK